MSNAAATLVGQNLGAKKPERAERSVWTAGAANMAFLGGISVLFVLASERLVRLFTQDPAVVPYGADCLRIVAYGFIFYAWGMVMAQAFNGAGDTFTPTLLNLFCFWLWEIPLAWLLSTKAGLAPRGGSVPIAVAFSTYSAAGAPLLPRRRVQTPMAV